MEILQPVCVIEKIIAFVIVTAVLKNLMFSTFYLAKGQPALCEFGFV